MTIKRHYTVGDIMEPLHSERVRRETFPVCPIDRLYRPRPALGSEWKIGSDSCAKCVFCSGIDRDAKIVFCDWHETTRHQGAAKLNLVVH